MTKGGYHMNTSPQASLDRIPLGSSVLPLRFLGMGAYLAWLYAAHFATTLFPYTDGSDGLSLTFIISNCTNAFCLVTCALLAERLAPLTAKRSVLWTAGGVSAAGTIMTAAFGALDGGGQIVLFVIGSVCTGFGTALLILLWSEFYASLPMRKVSVYYSLSFVLATAVNYLIAAMSPVLAITAASALPVASAIMLAMSMRILPVRQTESDSGIEDGTRWTFPIRPVLLMAVYSFAFSFIRETNGGATEFGMLGVGLIAAAVLVANLFFFHRFDTRLLYRLALPLMIAALLIAPLFGDEGIVVADILANTSYAGFVILTMIILSSICFRYGVNALWLFGLTRASRVIANVLGVSVGSASTHADPFLSSLELMAVIVTLSATSMFLLNDQDFRSAWGIVPQTERGKAGESLNYYDSFLGRCAQVAREYGLTHREEEVLALLAQGKSVPAIEKDLVISNGTAKSHVRHIYAKLDVHARDELIDLVGMKASGAR